jgi:hypothetical protein
MSNIVELKNFRPKPPPDDYAAMSALCAAFDAVCDPACPDEAAAWQNYSDAAENFIEVWRRSFP